MNIRYVTGDATSPMGDGHKVIVHICNDLGKWGKGFVLAVSKKWPQPEKQYKAAFAQHNQAELGEVQFVAVESDITVANIIGQHGISHARNKEKTPPIRYQAVAYGLEQVAGYAKQVAASVHMPRIGCGLAGGNWEQIEPIIQQMLTSQGIAVTVYDLAAP
ncbi:macro domain-containing protein [Neisseriaceae bacterium TC5R-5]|nr:macro domain-containing protein [Neisseriaceae bacterium TC5R-5]